MSDSKKPPKTSAQMDAVMRLMTGKEERTIAEKFADSNRPTWEQYKKDNKDKLDIVGAETKQMQNYRKELDEQRERILARGVNHGAAEKKKSKKRKKHKYSDDSDSNSEASRRRSKKKRKKHHKKKKHRKHHYHSNDSDSDSSDSDSEDSRRKRKHKKKKKKHKKKSDKKDDGEDERYRLSNFFTQGSDEE